MYYAVIFIELIVVFFTSRYVFSSLLFLFKKLFFSERVALGLVSILFLPGVFLHEFAHLLMAQALWVKGLHVEFKPVLHDGGLKLGSATITRCDPVRRLLIGLAPVLAGASVLILLTMQVADLYKESIPQNWPLLILFLYGVFVVANTMFSSKKDMEGGVGLLVLAAILIGVFEFAGVRVVGITMALLNHQNVVNVLPRLAVLFAVPVIINVIFVGVSLRFLEFEN